MKVSKNCVLICFLVFQFTVQAQENFEAVKSKVILPYAKNHEVLIKDNWKQFFKVDLFKTLHLPDKDISNNNNVFPVFFDSYGSHYPDMELLKGVTNKMMDSRRSNKNLDKYSFYRFLGNDNFREQFETNLNTSNNKNAMFYKEMVRAYSSKYKYEIEQFYEHWDSIRTKQVAEQLKQKLTETGKTKILMFTHGYNVPYSLAVMQTLALKSYLEDSLNQKDILFVPVFWPSNDMKNCDLDERNFNVKDKTKFLKGGFKNGTLFWYYSNQAYYAGVGVRKLLNDLNGVKASNGSEVSFLLYSHSLGATVMTTALINTFTKMRVATIISGNIKENWDTLKIKHPEIIEEMKTDPIGYDIAKEFKREPLPKQKIRLFLSAPAIPGENTFIDAKKELLGNLILYSTVNKKDIALTKRKTWFLGGNPYKFGATSLGCDYKGEVDKVKEIFKKYAVSDNIKIKPIPDFPEHDFFVYMSHKAYRDAIAEWLDQTPSNNTPVTARFDFESGVKELSDLLGDAKFKPLFEHISHRSAKRNNTYIKDRNINKTVNRILDSIIDVLIALEKPNEYSETALPKTNEYIFKIQDDYALVLVKRTLMEDMNPKHSEFMREKLIKIVDKRISDVCYRKYPMYAYKTSYDKFIKFVAINSGNDLFNIPGLASFVTPIEKSRWYFQRNDDRDYTGSLMVEIGTDYLRAPRRRQLKSYHTVLYGFDVYTPYFRDTSIFKTNSSYNVNDRPHASFQYFGWSKHGLSKRNTYRWSHYLKFGLIGGTHGRDYQTVVHQDVSFSQRPKGWGAQIANGGRFAFSIEGVHEWEIKQIIHYKRDNQFWNMYLQAGTNWKLGSFMTNAALKLQLSNKAFEVCNPHYINNRTRQNIILWSDNLMYALSFEAIGVQHNTMLQGFGIINTVESADFDPEAPNSDYILTREQVRPLIFAGHAVISYTSRYFSLFYRWSSFSAETYFTNTGATRISGNNRESLNIANRWHRFATIGISFNVRKW